jgi:pSer/pThr/pTyr-binding forkhead associated (FHA) protein
VPLAVLTILKFCLVALIFLFLARVLRAVWAQMTGPVTFDAPSAPTETWTTSRSDPSSRRKKGRPPATTLYIDEPPHRRGTTYSLGPEMTLGRAPGCAVVIEDTFASQLHARIFERDGEWFVEDLGSRNGTWLNRDQVHGPAKFEIGDRIRIGDTVLEAT